MDYPQQSIGTNNGGLSYVQAALGLNMTLLQAQCDPVGALHLAHHRQNTQSHDRARTTK